MKNTSLETPLNTSFIREAVNYTSNIRLFSTRDWFAYIAWVGLMVGLFAAIFGFLMLGFLNGVEYPTYVWNIPVGTFIFVLAISIDTIGHRTIYRLELEKAERLVHHVTIFAGITSTLALCLAYRFPVFMKIPSLVLIALSVVYSLIDEGFHWHRYYNLRSDRFEMWSHFFIFLGHLIMIFSWWEWYARGYPGVAETLRFLPLTF